MDKKLKVLVVDDQEILAKNIVYIIDGNKNVEKVKMAFNGKEALNIILDFKPDIVFTDMQMPEMTGLELIKKINELESESKPKFILITADRSADLVVATRELKFDIEYKPVRDVTLNEYIDNFEPRNENQPKNNVEENNTKESFFEKIFKRKK